MNANNTSDRELLELAAKAVNFEIIRLYQDETRGACIDDGKNVLQWNPLHDDGDALRLAVKLNMDFTLSGEHAAVAQAGSAMAQVYCNGDASSAARRAIVRVAVEIGRFMP